MRDPDALPWQRRATAIIHQVFLTNGSIMIDSGCYVDTGNRRRYRPWLLGARATAGFLAVHPGERLAITVACL